MWHDCFLTSSSEATTTATSVWVIVGDRCANTDAVQFLNAGVYEAIVNVQFLVRALQHDDFLGCSK